MISNPLQIFSIEDIEGCNFFLYPDNGGDGIDSGGEIAENKDRAIRNRRGGTIYMEDGTVIAGAQVLENTVHAMAIGLSDSSAVVRNATNAAFYMNGGSISAGENEIAFLNDSTAKLEMKGGEITANGEQSIALYNKNTKKNSVILSGGSLKATGLGSKAVENSGTIVYSKDVEIEAAHQYLVTVDSGSGDGTGRRGSSLLETSICGRNLGDGSYDNG